MVLSAIQAGLYPNILINDPKVGSMQLLHLPGSIDRVRINQSSSLLTLGTGCYCYHMIQAKQGLQGQKGQASVADMTRVPMASLLVLAGGSTETKATQRLVILDSTIAIKCLPIYSSLLLVLRQEMENVVESIIGGQTGSDAIIGLFQQVVEAEVKCWL